MVIDAVCCINKPSLLTRKYWGDSSFSLALYTLLALFHLDPVSQMHALIGQLIAVVVRFMYGRTASSMKLKKFQMRKTKTRQRAELPQYLVGETEELQQRETDRRGEIS